ncbi:MAG: hypothetical protein MR512_02400 [Anaerococcus sp.]|nr:hypothetical protein [Anaerococcus sp.]
MIFLLQGRKGQGNKKADVEELQNAFPQARYIEIKDTAHNFTNEEKRLYLFDQTYNFIKSTIKK